MRFRRRRALRADPRRILALEYELDLLSPDERSRYELWAGRRATDAPGSVVEYRPMGRMSVATMASVLKDAWAERPLDALVEERRFP
jgi:hypothetical protein